MKIRTTFWASFGRPLVHGTKDSLRPGLQCLSPRRCYTEKPPDSVNKYIVSFLGRGDARGLARHPPRPPRAPGADNCTEGGQNDRWPRKEEGLKNQVINQ